MGISKKSLLSLVFILSLKSYGYDQGLKDAMNCFSALVPISKGSMPNRKNDKDVLTLTDQVKTYVFDYHGNVEICNGSKCEPGTAKSAKAIILDELTERLYSILRCEKSPRVSDLWGPLDICKKIKDQVSVQCEIVNGIVDACSENIAFDELFLKISIKTICSSLKIDPNTFNEIIGPHLQSTTAQ